MQDIAVSFHVSTIKNSLGLGIISHNISMNDEYQLLFLINKQVDTGVVYCSAAVLTSMKTKLIQDANMLCEWQGSSCLLQLSYRVNELFSYAMYLMSKLMYIFQINKKQQQNYSCMCHVHSQNI